MNKITPIPYGRQHITDEDIQSVVETLRSDFLTQGPKIKEFEHAFADYTGSKYAVAVANGTAALHLCTLALGLKEGDKVITTSNTFAASANCIRYCGGEVVFADIDPETRLLDVDQVRHLLEKAPKGTYQGIIPVDFAGLPVNLEAFRELADEYGMWIIEDACHAPGGYFEDSKGSHQYCGNGLFAELAIFSFHPVKHIAAGEGGMVTTNDESLYQKLLSLRSHGIIKNSDAFVNSVEFAHAATDNNQPTNGRYPNWYMEMQELGYNFRITDFQCALGLSQLKRAKEGVEQRRKIARKYNDAFKERTFIKRQSASAEGNAYHLYVIEVEDRSGLYNYLRDHQIYAQIHYIPCHLMPYYRQFGWKEGDLPYAENYYKNCISLPMFPTLTDKQQEYVIEKVTSYYQ